MPRAKRASDMVGWLRGSCGIHDYRAPLGKPCPCVENVAREIAALPSVTPGIRWADSVDMRNEPIHSGLPVGIVTRDIRYTKRRAAK